MNKNHNPHTQDKLQALWHSGTLTYHSRTNHSLPRKENKLQDEIDKIAKYADQHEMVINHEKTKVMLFNTRNKYDFDLEVYLADTQIEVVDQVKLLGLTIRSDLNWKTNTQKMCQKGFSRMWI